jgi:hypothetical protein
MDKTCTQATEPSASLARLLHSLAIKVSNTVVLGVENDNLFEGF